MKQLTNFILSVEIDYPLDDVEQITFKFQQGSKRLMFEYPSDDAYRKNETDNIICLRWTAEQTIVFYASQPIRMDTLIRVVDSVQNPETEIVTLRISPTLFTREEVLCSDG